MSTQPIELESQFEDAPLAITGREPDQALLPRTLEEAASRQLFRMFRDPRVLTQQERKTLIVQLQEAVDAAPQVAPLRVLLGMALSVDLQAQESLEQLRQAATQEPDCFIARLKYGELLMRLRICGKAAEETDAAAHLAVNAAQSELARRQAAAIRTMMREGVERGGYAGFLSRLFRSRRTVKERAVAPMFVGTK